MALEIRDQTYLAQPKELKNKDSRCEERETDERLFVTNVKAIIQAVVDDAASIALHPKHHRKFSRAEREDH